MSLIYGIDVPYPPYPGEYRSVSTIPDWIIPLCLRASIALSGDQSSGITVDENGNLLVYKEVSEADRINFQELENSSEVWITFESDPTKN